VLLKAKDFMEGFDKDRIGSPARSDFKRSLVNAVGVLTKKVDY
jgi:hypothetical protein